MFLPVTVRYSNEDIARHLGVSVEEVRRMRRRILDEYEKSPVGQAQKEWREEMDNAKRTEAGVAMLVAEAYCEKHLRVVSGCSFPDPKIDNAFVIEYPSGQKFVVSVVEMPEGA